MDSVDVNSPLFAVSSFVDLLEKHQISYLIGGSFASSVQGEYRTTNDIDFLCQISMDKLEGFIGGLSPDFIHDSESIKNSLKSKISFNIIHEESFTKIDVFNSIGQYERSQLERAIPVYIKEINKHIRVASAEDIISAKLIWYKKGNMTSERQWNDILGVYKVQKNKLDYEYMQSWADLMDINILYKKAIS